MHANARVIWAQILISFGALGSACTTTPKPSRAPGAPPPEWVEQRVREAHERLGASDAARLVAACIEAHGGLDTWLGQGTVRFEFDYRPVDKPERRLHTENLVDLWRSLARQTELGEGADAELGWNGREAWITPNRAAFPSSPRFWATTPYYFFALPFVAADPGVRFELLADAELEGEVHHLVKLSYEAGVGDSPKDYYVLYIHPKTHRMSALRYVVAYPGFFPEGGHTPEKLLVFREQQTVQGLLVSHRYDVFAWDDATGTGAKVTDVDVKQVRFGERVEAGVFDPPSGAEISQALD